MALKDFWNKLTGGDKVALDRTSFVTTARSSPSPCRTTRRARTTRCWTNASAAAARSENSDL